MSNPNRNRQVDPELYQRLIEESKAPYRGLRRFIYFSVGASGLIGAFVFLMQSLAGKNLERSLPNLALQVGIVALVGWLLRRDRPSPKDHP
ncbi:MAG: DUF3493 domain-containing protein [Cyanobacteria bacterium P01_A01_bin.135]